MMTKERELLRRALDCYDNACSRGPVDAALGRVMIDIEAHLAAEEGKQEEEPVCVVHNTDTPGHYAIITPAVPAGTKLYLHPSCPQNKETATRSEDVVTNATHRTQK